MVTDNGANYRAKDFTRTVTSLAGRHQWIRPCTPRHNGKVERYNRLLADEVLYVRPYASEQARRDAIGVWVNHFNYRLMFGAAGGSRGSFPRPTVRRSAAVGSTTICRPAQG